MTAYVSRLLRRVDRSAGIRPRPRSRYEPDPGTYFDQQPIEVDHEWQTDTDGTAVPPAEFDPTSPSTPGRAREPRPDYLPQANRPVIADPAPTVPPAYTAAGPFELANHKHPNDSQPQPPGDSDPLSSLSDGRAASTSTTPATSPVLEVGNRRATPDPGPSPETTGATIPSPPSAHGPWPRHPVPDGEPTSEMDPRTGQTPLPAMPFAGPRTYPAAGAARPLNAEPATNPPQADPAEGAARPLDAVPAAGPRYSSIAMPNPALRQRIVDAVIEPVRADPTEVVVHIDRIDVRAAGSSQSPPPAPRHPRAAPMSLDNYLRAQSRRRSG